MKLIKNARLILPGRVLEGSLIISKQIEQIILREDIRKPDQLSEIEVIDAEGLYLAPGFIDIHIHGAGGFDTMDSSYQALNGISKVLLKSGVSSFLPTTMTMPAANIQQALDNIQETIAKGTTGARILGAHVEGPFINPMFKGAQAEKDIILADDSLLNNYLDIIKITTLAPEKEGAQQFIKYLAERGVTVSVGHSAASYEQVIEAKGWGISHVTHLFNAMTGLHHRRPGIVGAALTSELTLELIADFVHVHPAVVKMVMRAKDLDKIVLITDQMEAGSLGNGEYSLGGQKVIVKDGAARLENGQLASSVLTLDQAVRNIKEITDLSLPQIINMVTANPAKVIGMEEQLGKIAPGYKADLVLLTEDLQVNKVIVDGEILLDKEGLDEINYRKRLSGSQ